MSFLYSTSGSGGGGDYTLTSRWRYEDNSDTSTAIDSEDGNDGNITGASYVSSPSLEGSYALDFGASSDEYYVEVPHDASIDYTGDFSVGFRAYVRSRPSRWFGYVTKAGTDANTGWAVVNQNPGLWIRIDGSDFGFSYGEIPLDTATRVGISHDNGSQETALFINGSKQETIATTSVSSNSHGLYHGTNSWSTADSIDGVLDDIVVAPEYLSETDWKSVY